MENMHTVKKERVTTTVADMNAATLTFTVRGLAPLVLVLDNLSDEVKTAALYHGLTARVKDAAALDKGATPEDKRAEMERLVTHYNSGATEWNVARQGGGGGGVSIQDVIDAMGEVFGADGAKARAMAQNLAAKRGTTEKEAYKIIAKAPEVVKALAAIRASRATYTAEDLLTEMEDAGG